MTDQLERYVRAYYLENGSFRMYSLDCQVLIKIFMYKTFITFYMQVFMIFFFTKWKREQIMVFMKAEDHLLPNFKMFQLTCRILMWEVNNVKK